MATTAEPRASFSLGQRIVGGVSAELPGASSSER
jgi:hypothetical protein